MSKGTYAQATVFGRLGKDPESRDVNGGKMIVTLTLATTSGWGDRETTSWWKVVIFDEKKGQAALDYLKKGQRVLIIGELVINKWTNRDGKDVYTPEIHMGFESVLNLVDKDEGSMGNTSRSKPADKPKPAFDTDLDDDVPF